MIVEAPGVNLSPAKSKIRSRLDAALAERGLCESRERAARSVLAGKVRVNRQLVDKPSHRVSPEDLLEVQAPERFVSRGGHKLEHALQAFGINASNRKALDLGASTGGFTDCLLQHGAAQVVSVDVGQGQLAWKLRQDPRVICLERTNARHLTSHQFPVGFLPCDLVVVDCSFISLKLILPAAISFLRPCGQTVALVKPQFEAGKKEADRGKGVIKDPLIHARILAELEDFSRSIPGVQWRSAVESPLLGPAGNKEFLVLLEKAD